jgi:signal peptidase I
VTEPRRRGRGAIELVLTLAGAIALALLIQAFLVKPYRIPSGSMLPTLHLKQRVLVNRIGTHFSDPKVGDIIVFHPPDGYQSGCLKPDNGSPCAVTRPNRSSLNFIKRVVALPGDRISIVGGHVVRNGHQAKEPFITPCTSGGACDFPKTITVPAHHYYVMGDNRGSSDDSRYWGPVPAEWVIGEAFMTYWPPDRIGFL